MVLVVSEPYVLTCAVPSLVDGTERGCPTSASNRMGRWCVGQDQWVVSNLTSRSVKWYSSSQRLQYSKEIQKMDAIDISRRRYIHFVLFSQLLNIETRMAELSVHCQRDQHPAGPKSKSRTKREVCFFKAEFLCIVYMKYDVECRK